MIIDTVSCFYVANPVCGCVMPGFLHRCAVARTFISFLRRAGRRYLNGRSNGLTLACSAAFTSV